MNILRSLFGGGQRADASRYVQRGEDLASREQYRAAIGAWEQALSLYQASNDLHGLMIACRHLGDAYLVLGDSDSSSAFLKRSLDYAETLDDQAMIAGALGGLGNISFTHGDNLAALESYRRSLEAGQKSSDSAIIGLALGNLGNTYGAMGDFTAAAENLEASMDIARQIKDFRGLAEAGNSLGNVYRLQGKLDQAIATLSTALDGAQQLGIQRIEAYILGNLGNARLARGDVGQAIRMYEQSLALVKALQDRRGETQALSNLGALYMSIGEIELSQSYYQQSLAAARARQDAAVASQALVNLATIHVGRREYAEAEAMFQEALQLKRQINDRRGEGVVLGNLSVWAYAAGDLDLARSYVDQRLALARAIGDQEGQVQALALGGALDLEAGELSAAGELFQAGLDLSETLGMRPIAASLRTNLGAVAYRAGEMALAKARLFESIASLETMRESLDVEDGRRVSLFDRQINAYHLLQKLLVLTGEHEDALEIAERARARIFVELLARRAEPAAGDVPGLPTRLEIAAIAVQQQATLVEYSIVYDYIPEPSGAKTIDLFIWVVNPLGVIHFRQLDLQPMINSDTSSIHDLVTQAREAVGVRGRFATAASKPAAPPDELRQLYQLLVKPIEDLLPPEPAQHVVIVPHGELFMTPFAALVDDDGRQLIDRCTLRFAPSIQSLTWTSRLRTRRQLADEYVIVGNPSMPSRAPGPDKAPEALPALPYAEREAQAIARLLGAQPLIGAAATRDVVLARLPSARIIHLATHGLLDMADGSRTPGAVALAPTATDSGFLLAEEIATLRLACDLAVLSACNTGRGRVTGDGIIGLGRALLVAGAPRVVVSLWAVSDQSTASLMTSFYEHLASTDDAAAALREAMIAARVTYSNTAAWAGFVLFGEGL